MTSKELLCRSDDRGYLEAEELVGTVWRTFFRNGLEEAREEVDPVELDLPEVSPYMLFDPADGYTRTSLEAGVGILFPDGTLDHRTLTVGDILIGVRGDVNGSGFTNAADASYILRYAAEEGLGFEPFFLGDPEDPSEHLARYLADMDGDGTISARDASYVLIYTANEGLYG